MVKSMLHTIESIIINVCNCSVISGESFMSCYVTLQLLLSPNMSMVIMDSDMIVRHVSLGQTWCLILSLVSVWSSPLCHIFCLPINDIGNSCL